MKKAWILSFLVLGPLSVGSGSAQVNLPLDAPNCAILNALDPASVDHCPTPDLGPSRGLIIRLEDADTIPDTQTASKQARVSVSKPQNPVPIDRKAAKSDSGYYIYFAFDSETLEKEYRDHLDDLATVLASEPVKNNCIKITGHTDTVGSEAYNLALSERRAKAVYMYLTAHKKIDKARLITAGLGESQPLPDEKGSSPYNRRVEFSSKPKKDTCQPQN